MERQRVLVIDDDPNVSEVVATYLRREGAIVEVCSDGETGLETALADPPDLVVLDLMLPGLDGLEVCRRIQALAPVPVVMLTAKGDETERIVGLELGADDYVSKPFSPRELVARVKAVLRRAHAPLQPVGAGAAVLDAGVVQIDVAAHEVRRGDEILPLTAREFELLVHLVRHPRRAFRREELLERVWGSRYGDTSTVTVHVRRLREKVEEDPSNPRHLVTVWGVGYRWEP
ncbi:response regulator [Aquihabitans sp. McL0605]|uniref:response regulator n=1 Tax=Aquihabitans sp. McL0605 TaxID=3415671 RepID=UPI003CF2A8B2